MKLQKSNDGVRTVNLRSPYPWFGGKARIAAEVWKRFGDVRNYVEPFFGGGATLLARPQPFDGTETINDLNGWVCNFWRAIQRDSELVARYADWPVSELDLQARGDWLFYGAAAKDFIERLRADASYCDFQIAGWWVWGICCWIGTGWGPRKIPHLSNAGRCVNRGRPHLIDAGQGVNRQLPHLSDAGQGVNRQLPHISNAGQAMAEYLRDLAERMRKVRVCCGDWSRVCSPCVTTRLGVTALFLDPPYVATDRADCYGSTEDRDVGHQVAAWCREHQDDPKLRIALCGYAGDYGKLPGWTCLPWKTNGGYASQSSVGMDNSRRERIWFSPHCLKVRGLRASA
jgi:site-specific DNA-adenine methylase